MSDDTEVTCQPPADPSYLLPLIADAAAGFRHAETIVQQRLYNFLMAESILLLASAATLGASESFGRRALVLVVSVLGALLGLAWTVLGRRQRPFIDLQMEVVQQLERRFGHQLWRVSEPIAKLRDGDEVIFPISGTRRKLSKLELKMRSGNLLSWAPLAFVLAFVALFAIALRGWS